MKKIGFLGLGVMGLPMALNVLNKSGCPVIGFDVAQKQKDAFQKAGGTVTDDPVEIYKTCDVIMQMLPTHATIINSIEQAIQYGKPGNIILDLDSTAPEILLDLYPKVEAAGMHLLDSPVSGGNPMAIAGTLAIMTGGKKEIFEELPSACFGVVMAKGIDNNNAYPEIEQFLDESIQAAMQRFEGRKVKEDPDILPYREAFRALNILSNIVLNELDWWVASQWENMPIHYEYKTRQNFSCAIK